MSEKETILLDVTLKNVIDHATFNAVLPNGHEIVAYTRLNDKMQAMDCLRPGNRVQVEMSPFDMSKGCIVLQHESES